MTAHEEHGRVHNSKTLRLLPHLQLWPLLPAVDSKFLKKRETETTYKQREDKIIKWENKCFKDKKSREKTFYSK